MSLDPSCAADAIGDLIQKVRAIEARHQEIRATDLGAAIGMDKGDRARMRLAQQDLVEEVAELRSMLETYVAQQPEVLTSAQVARELSAITNELLIRATKAARLNAERVQLTNDLDLQYRRVNPDGTAEVAYDVRAKALLQSVEPLAGFDPDSTVAPARASLDGVMTAMERGLSHEIDEIGAAADAALRQSNAPFRTTSGEFGTQVYAALLGLQQIPAMNGRAATPIHPAVQKYAASLREIEARYIDRLQKAGVPFHVIENHTKRSYALDKMQQNPDLAKQMIEQHVDYQAMGFEAVDEFFEHMTGVQSKSISSLLQRSYGSSLMSGHQFHRKVQFKSQEAEFLFFSEFGDHTPMHYAIEPVRSVARASAVATLWGNGGLDNLRDQFYNSVRMAIDAGQMTRKDAKSLVTKFHNRLDAVTGRYDTESSPRVTSVKESLAAFVRAAMLVRTAVYSFTVDPANIALRATSFKRTSTMVDAADRMPESRHLGIIDQTLAGFGRADREWIADTALSAWRLAHGTAAGEAIRRFQLGQVAPGGTRDVPEGLLKVRNAAQSVQSFVMRSNLINMGHRFNTRLNTTVNLTNIASMMPLKWSQVKDRYPVAHHRLAMFGIGERQWDALRAAGTEKIGGVDMPNAALLEAQDPRAFEIFRAYLDSDVQAALSIPGSSIRRMMMLRQNPRDPAGAVIEMMMMFQAWTAGFYTRTLPTMVREARLGSSGPLASGGRVAASAATLVAAGWAATQMQQILAGKPMYAVNSGYGWSMAFANSGFALVMAEPLKQIAYNVSQGREMDVSDLVTESLTMTAPVAGYMGSAIETAWNIGMLAGADEHGRARYKREYDIMAAANRLAPVPVGIVAKGFTDAMLREWFFDRSPRDMVRYRKTMEGQGRIPGTAQFFTAEEF